MLMMTEAASPGLEVSVCNAVFTVRATIYAALITERAYKQNASAYLPKCGQVGGFLRE